MKISDGYMLRTVAGKNIVISIGADTDFNGMLTLNDTGVFFWKLLEKETTKEQMLEAVLKEYDAPREEVAKDIDDFILKLKNAKIITE